MKKIENNKNWLKILNLRPMMKLHKNPIEWRIFQKFFSGEIWAECSGASLFVHHNQTYWVYPFSKMPDTIFESVHCLTIDCLVSTFPFLMVLESCEMPFCHLMLSKFTLLPQTPS